MNGHNRAGLNEKKVNVRFRVSVGRRVRVSVVFADMDETVLEPTIHQHSFLLPWCCDGKFSITALKERPIFQVIFFNLSECYGW